MIDGQGTEFIKNEFPVHIRAHFIGALNRAYGLVEACQKEHKWLGWKPGNDALGILRKIAAEYEIIETIKRNNLPLQYEIQPNVIKNAYHVELITPKSRATINQVESKMSVPRPAEFRKYLIPSNIPTLFANDPDFNDENKPVYIILAHNAFEHKLRSAVLGIPNSDLRGWSAALDLFKEPFRHDVAPVEMINQEENLVRFSDFLKEVEENEKGEDNK